MNTTEMQQYIGKYGQYAQRQLSFNVEVIDVRARYGTFDFLIKPLAGDGQQWVEQGKMTFKEPLA